MGLLYTSELACRKQLFRITEVSFLAVPVNRNTTAVLTVKAATLAHSES